MGTARRRLLSWHIAAFVFASLALIASLTLHKDGTNEPGAAVDFTFDGIAFTVMGESYDDHGSFSVSIDNNPLGEYSGWRNETAGVYAGNFPIYASPLLQYGKHEVTIQNIGKQTPREGNVLSIDFIEVQVSSSTSANSTASSIAASQSNAAQGSNEGGSSIEAIVGGAVGGIVALLLLLAAIYFCLRRKRQRQSSTRRPSIDDTVERPLSPLSTPMLQPFRRPYSDSTHMASSNSDLPSAVAMPTNQLVNPYSDSSRVNSASYSNLPSSAEVPSSIAPFSADHPMAVTNPEEELHPPPAYVAPASRAPAAKGSLI